MINRLSNWSVTPSTRAMARESAALKDQDPKERVSRLARNTAKLPPIVLLPHHRGLVTPDFVKLLPTKAPRGSARNTGLMISVKIKETHSNAKTLEK